MTLQDFITTVNQNNDICIGCDNGVFKVITPNRLDEWDDYSKYKDREIYRVFITTDIYRQAMLAVRL